MLARLSVRGVGQYGDEEWDSTGSNAPPAYVDDNFFASQAGAGLPFDTPSLPDVSLPQFNPVDITYFTGAPPTSPGVGSVDDFGVPFTSNPGNGGTFDDLLGTVKGAEQGVQGALQGLGININLGGLLNQELGSLTGGRIGTGSSGGVVRSGSGSGSGSAGKPRSGGTGGAGLLIVAAIALLAFSKR